MIARWLLLVFLATGFCVGCTKEKKEKGVVETDACGCTYVDEANPSDNFYFSGTLRCGQDSNGNEKYILLWFDDSIIKANMHITSLSDVKITKVVLRLYITDVQGGGGDTFYIGKVDDNWVGCYVTWNTYPSTTLLSSFTGPTSTGWFEISTDGLKEIVEGWFKGTFNNGICIEPSAYLSPGVGFSCDSSQGQNPPVLVVYYEKKK